MENIFKIKCLILLMYKLLMVSFLAWILESYTLSIVSSYAIIILIFMFYWEFTYINLKGKK